MNQRLKVNGLRRADLVRIQCSLNKFGQIHEIETTSEGVSRLLNTARLFDHCRLEMTAYEKISP